VTALRAAGHDVAYGSEWDAGAEDEVRLQWSWDHDRIINTEDADFISLAVVQELPVHGLFMVRLVGMARDAKIARMLAAVAEIGPMAGEIAMVDPVGIRRRLVADAIADRRARHGGKI
jgi:predicted nuclease of predicted toxin-antitoxin system